jgi:hypothetical protein
MGSVYHVGEVLHLVGTEHGDDGLAGGEVLKHPGRDHIVIKPSPAQDLKADPEGGKVVGQVHRGHRAQIADIGQRQQVWEQIAALVRANENDNAVGTGLGQLEDGGQVQVGPEGAHIAKNGPVYVSERLGDGQMVLGEHGVVAAIGQQGHVAVTGGEVTHEIGGGGKAYIGRGGELTLPNLGIARPILGTVVDQSTVRKLVQKSGAQRSGAPE